MRSYGPLGPETRYILSGVQQKVGALPEDAKKRLASQVHEEIARQGLYLYSFEQAVLMTSHASPDALIYALQAIDEKAMPFRVEQPKNLPSVQGKPPRQDAAELSPVQILVLVFLWLILIAIPIALLGFPAVALAVTNSEVGTIGLAVGLTALILQNRKP